MKFLKYFFSFGLPFGIGMGIYFGILYDFMRGVTGGLASGILFGIIMAIITLKRNNKQQALKESISATVDNIVFDSYANHIAGFYPTEGRLFLSKTALIFIKNNSEKMEFPLNIIQDLKLCKHRLNPNALCFLANGKEVKFIFSTIGEGKNINNVMWIDIIRKEIDKSHNTELSL